MAPLIQPNPKHPLRRFPSPTLPPVARSRVALGLTAFAAQGRLALQVCRDCGTVHYPPQEACRRCLSPRLDWRPQDGAGELISDTVLRHSNELYFRARAPLRLGSVRLDAGPTAIAFVHGACPAPPARVRLRAALDRAGAAVLAALPDNEVTTMADDRVLRELTNDPAGRKILITDGRAAVAVPLARALAAAGADLIYVGMPEPWPPAAVVAYAPIAEALVRPLDVTDSESVVDLAAEIGGKVDILINTAEHHRPHAILARGIETARAEMEVNYFGLLRLAQSFAPALRARAVDGAAAWVNLLSIFALTSFPPHGTFSASKAAAHSLAQGLRAELRGAGLRVVNVYPGPIEEDWNDRLPPPKLAPAALAGAIVAALRDGVEDVYPGDVAQDWLARWRDNPKALEREVAAIL
ncbi:MAG TPA: SDR family NAD(P)-dependent oxidoreductase [Xanthobacteraceae bacterium]|nr:SDR family NAD(P)-dependent oxidoreductase [Xanthobacteraceae bacterium]